MFIICRSPKGGVGTSVVAAALALRHAHAGHPTVLIDLAGDQPDLLDVAPPSSLGIGDWVAASRFVTSPPIPVSKGGVMPVSLPSHSRRHRDRGQATADYALVIPGAAALALLVTGWAVNTSAVGDLFDAVIDSVARRVG